MGWRRTAVVAVAVVLLGACGGGSGAQPAGDVDPAAFSGTAPSVAGGEVELAAYADEDLVVWFWSPW